MFIFCKIPILHIKMPFDVYTCKERAAKKTFTTTLQCHYMHSDCCLHYTCNESTNLFLDSWHIIPYTCSCTTFENNDRYIFTEFMKTKYMYEYFPLHWLSPANLLHLKYQHYTIVCTIKDFIDLLVISCSFF